MDEPDLTHWLRDWRRLASSEASDRSAWKRVEPVAVPDDDVWVALTATAEPGVVRLDVVIEPELERDVVGWVLEQLLRWSFNHPYPDAGLQFALAPDGALVGCVCLALEPDATEDELRERIADAIGAVEEHWTLILADALLQAHHTALSAQDQPAAAVRA